MSVYDGGGLSRSGYLMELIAGLLAYFAAKLGVGQP